MITVMDTLKQTRPGKHLKPIVLLAFTEDKKLCVVEHLKEYLRRTKPLRNGQTQLMISYVKPYNPVSRDTIYRWTKKVVASAGLNSRPQHTRDHESSRLANSVTFAKFYQKPI